ncbi:MAG TPA: hypothetical protein VM101_01780 [Flavitalea sp.]|nr:hypothetical protein [Flavitalea sp.]
MERRKFVLLTLAGTAVLTFPLSECGTANHSEPPQFLQSLLGKDKIKEIGKAYVEQFPNEGNREKLEALLSAQQKVNPGSAVNLSIQNEFRNGSIVIINGWILSLTEARQSALYYLNS